MRIQIQHRCADVASYRAARVKSLFNAEHGDRFDLAVDLPLEGLDWRVGCVVGPSGSGKTSIGRQLFDGTAFYEATGWPADAPIIDAIAPAADVDTVTAALAAVGLGTVPAWLRPYHVLSNGERFRADLARIVAEAPATVVIDEFTSVVDRQIAKIGALAFQKAWRRTGGQAVLLSCHYDILDWLEPDWVYDTGTATFTGRGLWRRPRLTLELRATDWRYWPLFAPHHYLTAPRMIAARCYIGTIDGELVAHVAVGTKNLGRRVEARACRLVVMPEWQGAGVGMRFLNAVAQLQLEGQGRLPGRHVTTLFHTSHPGLAAALRRDRHWRQVSAVLHGGRKRTSAASIARASGVQAGYGGHFRAVQGFRYLGAPADNGITPTVNATPEGGR